MVGRIFLVLGTTALALMFGGHPNLGLAQQRDEGPGDLRALGAVASSLPAGHIAKYLIPFAVSDTQSSPSERVITVISITNVGGPTPCPVSVDWRIGVGTQSAAVSTSTIPGAVPGSNNVGETFDYCSRSLPVGSVVVVCNVLPVPELTFFEGKAVVGTTSACLNRLAVDARLYHLGANDSPTLAIGDLKVVRLPQGNLGD